MTPEPVKARIDYGERGLEAADLHLDPLVQLQRWLDDAAATDQLVEPSAMALATVDDEGRPTVRTVLLRGISAGRLLFFTSYDSRKAQHMAAHPEVALLFRWANPQRQVEVRGTVAMAAATESDEYFATRPRQSQIGAHASPQSQVIADRAQLDELVTDATHRWRHAETIPRPSHWGGYAVTPWEMEFWQGRSNRLHDRFRYPRRSDGGWGAPVRLAP